MTHVTTQLIEVTKVLCKIERSLIQIIHDNFHSQILDFTNLAEQTTILQSYSAEHVVSENPDYREYVWTCLNSVFLSKSTNLRGYSTSSSLQEKKRFLRLLELKGISFSEQSLRFSEKETMEGIFGKGAFGRIKKCVVEIISGEPIPKFIPAAAKLLTPNPEISPLIELSVFRWISQQNFIAHLKEKNTAPLLPLLVFDHLAPFQFITPRGIADVKCNFMETGVRLTNQTLIKWTCDLMDGLARLHEKFIIHNDLKPSNLIIFGNHHYHHEIIESIYELVKIVLKFAPSHGRAIVRDAWSVVLNWTTIKIADFGMSIISGSRESPKSEWKTLTPCTIAYRAPEIWEGMSPGMESDLWSAGCSLFEFAFGGQILFKEQRLVSYVPVSAAEDGKNVRTAYREGLLEFCLDLERGEASERGGTEKQLEKKGQTAFPNLQKPIVLGYCVPWKRWRELPEDFRELVKMCLKYDSFQRRGLGILTLPTVSRLRSEKNFLINCADRAFSFPDVQWESEKVFWDCLHLTGGMAGVSQVTVDIFFRILRRLSGVGVSVISSKLKKFPYFCLLLVCLHIAAKLGKIISLEKDVEKRVEKLNSIPKEKRNFNLIHLKNDSAMICELVRFRLV